MIRFEQTFADFLLHHQEQHNRTYHFLILMDALISAAKRIQHYYLTGALQGNLGQAGQVNVQGENVMRMDQIAQEITIHYLRASGRVIHAVSEESKEIIPLNPDGRYFVYFDPLDGSSNIPHGLPVGFMFGIAKRNLDGPEDGHLRAGKDYIAAGMFVIPTGTFTLGLKNAGTWRFQIDETMTFVKPTRVILPARRRHLGTVVQRGQPPRLRPAGAAVDRGQREPLRLPVPGGVGRRFPPHDPQRRHVHVPGHRQSPRSEAEPAPGQAAADVRGGGGGLHVPRSGGAGRR